MVTVNGAGGADTGVVLRCQVKILETLQKETGMSEHMNVLLLPRA